MLNTGPVDILVVEDSDHQRESIVTSLQEAIPGVQVVAVGDGQDAMDFLLARGKWADRTGEDPPKLILLDLEMPGVDGFSILAQLRSLEAGDSLTLAPVVIFTDNHAKSNIARSYRCGANSYIMKPLSFPDFKSVINTVGKYWVTLNKSHV